MVGRNDQGLDKEETVLYFLSFSNMPSHWPRLCKGTDGERLQKKMYGGQLKLQWRECYAIS